MTIQSATSIGRATGLTLSTVCELLEAGWRFIEDEQAAGFILTRTNRTEIQK